MKHKDDGFLDSFDITVLGFMFRDYRIKSKYWENAKYVSDKLDRILSKIKKLNGSVKKNRGEQC